MVSVGSIFIECLFINLFLSLKYTLKHLKVQTFVLQELILTKLYTSFTMTTSNN